MEYQLIKGFRRNANVVWSPQERYLYAHQCERNNRIEYICYQKILHDQYVVRKNKEKMKKKNKKCKENSKYIFKKKEKVLNCSARIKIDANGQCHRNTVEHSNHANHESLKKDMVTKNHIIDRCIEFKNVAKDLPIKVPANDIFTIELSR